MQLCLEPTRARGVDALRVAVAQLCGSVQRFQCRLEFRNWIARAIFCEKKVVIVDVTAPAAELAGFVMAQGNPVGIGRQVGGAGGLHERAEAEGEESEQDLHESTSSAGEWPSVGRRRCGCQGSTG
ncbi:hypothetical protein ACEOCR_18615 [Aeromonas dhakensis]|uniref:hypothetical protein n=1 Tax=Aeromonas dhakensis TaxID=196024 RepID=UPI0035713A1B